MCYIGLYDTARYVCLGTCVYVCVCVYVCMCVCVRACVCVCVWVQTETKPV